MRGGLGDITISGICVNAIIGDGGARESRCRLRLGWWVVSVGRR
jgi:hypothetical protein